MSGPLRIGIINLMPQAERYERMLRGALARAQGCTRASPRDLTLVFIRLSRHTYASSDAAHLRDHYVSYAEAQAGGPLDRLLLTGAPVEELPFEAVHYWSELQEILRSARSEVASTFGICWGAMALAKLLGIGKTLLPRKLLGIYEARSPSADADADAPSAWYAQSRHAGIDDVAVEAAARAGEVRLGGRGPRTGHTVFSSADGRYVAHLGHPEYVPARLIEEYERDLRAGRVDVSAPEGIARWSERAQADGADFLARWLAGANS